MKTQKLKKFFEDFAIEVFLIKQVGVQCAELNTYTAGGVNMIVWLNPFTVEEFRDWVRDFDVDEQIDIHRQDKRYCDAFSISNSVEDFTEYHARMKQILKNLEDLEEGYQIFTVKTDFIFSGNFKVKARDVNEAIKIVENDCGLVLGGDIHSSLSEETVKWEFDMHPEKKIKISKTKLNMEIKALQLVTFEQAKKLRNLGFNWYKQLHGKYEIKTGNKCSVSWHESDNGIWEYTIPAPTVALVLKWFRDVKELFGEIIMGAYNECTGKYLTMVWNIEGDCIREIDVNEYYETFEQAESALVDELLIIVEKEKWTN